MKWISVKDRLPENKNIVICYGNRGHKDKGAYRAIFYKGDEFNKQQFISGTLEVKNVTHWFIIEPPTENK